MNCSDHVKIFVMMSGLPYSGKTSCVNNILGIDSQFDIMDPIGVNTKFVYSTDDYIECLAKKTNKSYNEIFNDEYKNAQKFADMGLDIALYKGTELIVWDQTNLTIKSRKNKLVKIPDDYVKLCVYVSIDENILQERIALRKDKIVSMNVINSFKNVLEKPSMHEGFDAIVEIHNGVSTNFQSSHRFESIVNLINDEDR